MVLLDLEHLGNPTLLELQLSLLENLEHLVDLSDLVALHLLEHLVVLLDLEHLGNPTLLELLLMLPENLEPLVVL